MEVEPNGAVPPPPPEKKSGFWSGVKWLLGGAVIGIAGYEGVRFWRRVRGDTAAPDDSRPALNPASPGGHHGGGMGPSMPQILPYPMPLPWPGVQQQQQAPVANPPEIDDKLTAKERRAAARQRKLERRLEAIEEAMWEED